MPLIVMTGPNTFQYYEDGRPGTTGNVDVISAEEAAALGYEPGDMYHKDDPRNKRNKIQAAPVADQGQNAPEGAPATSKPAESTSAPTGNATSNSPSVGPPPNSPAGFLDQLGGGAGQEGVTSGGGLPTPQMDEVGAGPRQDTVGANFLSRLEGFVGGGTDTTAMPPANAASGRPGVNIPQPSYGGPYGPGMQDQASMMGGLMPMPEGNPIPDAARQQAAVLSEASNPRAGAISDTVSGLMPMPEGNPRPENARTPGVPRQPIVNAGGSSMGGIDMSRFPGLGGGGGGTSYGQVDPALVQQLSGGFNTGFGGQSMPGQGARPVPGYGPVMDRSGVPNSPPFSTYQPWPYRQQFNR